MSIMLGISSYSGTLSLNAENDIFAPGNTDKFYTHGSRISYTTPVEVNYDGLLSGNVLFGDKEAFEISVGQYMYTPDDIEIVELQEGERPYAGVAFLEAAQIKHDEKQYSRIGYLAGVIGPYSYAEETQTWIHELTGSELPLGWDNQIDTEPLLNLQYTYKYKLFSNEWFDLTPRSETALGNAHIFTGFGTDLRVGYNMDDWSYSTMEPVPRGIQNFSGFLLLGSDAKYVARNITLDGNTWEDSYSIDKEPFVWEYYCGFGLKYSWMAVEYKMTRRSEEFKGQESKEDFGSVALRFSF